MSECISNKFNSWLNKLYELHQPPIPQYVLEIVKTQINKRYGFLHIPDMTEAKIARLLSDIDFVDYYGKEKEILEALEFKTLPEITVKSKEKMKQYLVNMQVVFNKHNIRLPFKYIMYKLCQQFEQKMLIPFLTLELSHEKLYKYDKIWRLISDEMRWFFIKSDTTVCKSTHSQPILGLKSPSSDRNSEPWSVDEKINVLKGVSKGLTLEQIALAHNRTQKNIETQLKNIVIEKHETKTHSVEDLIKLTGLPEEVIVDAITRYETRKNRPLETVIENVNEGKEKDNESEILSVLKDIQGMLRYIVSKI